MGIDLDKRFGDALALTADGRILAIDSHEGITFLHLDDEGGIGDWNGIPSFRRLP